ncbi:hypothetical protein [Alicyclobacillus macrosporangiidus]|uniref:hypothetical protein n=1 Tax=Alicyclobacillus macrosporangiidus TaxID=392015 RepID=UPI0004984D35|nr:hypothetical protein [Alicyclobacillus macrosporangiidus]
MVSRAQCQQYVGQWVRFHTRYGQHVGLVERVTPDALIVVSPARCVPKHVPSMAVGTDEQKLDLALAWWGGYGPGVGGAYGPYGGWGWGGPLARWAVAFLSIYALWGLLLW